MSDDPRNPLEIESRFKRAAIAALWFAAAFCVVCAALAIASAAGLMGEAKDAPLLGVMALGGAILFGAQLVANRVFLKVPPNAHND